MPFEIAKKVIDNVADGTIVDMFGGEALLEINLLNRIVDYANAQGRRLAFQLFSNGSRYDDAVKELLRKGVSIGVSFDGLGQFARTHDDAMTQTVIRNIQAMKADYPWLGVKTAITPDSIDSMVDSVKYMNNLGMNFVSQFLLREDVWTPGSIKLYDKRIRELVDYFGSKLEEGSDVWISYLAGHVIDNYRTTGCWAGSIGCAVSWTGDIYPCQRFLTKGSPFIIGNVDEGITDNRFRKYSIKNFIGCGSCNVADRCSNVCIASQWEHGSLCSPIKSVCELTKITYDAIEPLMKYKDRFNERFKERMRVKEG
jgi:radical SAM protein with 4Fe4S-binding SPASM domain